ncbi:MAG: AraC family transcriptional regulator [Aeromicrobium sp.]|uniref:helix-turn-helix domain-containing protein n=1 Tax=Aeromicrobium sp. TaxID=1871063 RepID=UPI0039E4DB76
MPTCRHDTHELAWASEGTATLTIEGIPWVVSPECAVWIPKGVPHKVPVLRKAIVFPLWFEDDAPAPDWEATTAVWVSQELRSQLMRYIQSRFGSGETESAERDTLLGMLPSHAQHEPQLPTPSDPRAAFVAERLLADPSDARSIEEWAKEVGTSSKTLQRAFTSTTGLNFVEWRMRARLRASLPLLAQGVPVSQIAERVGYSSAPGFITAFRRQFGHTPTAHGQPAEA